MESRIPHRSTEWKYVQDAIHGRRAIRRYTSEPMDRASIEQLIGAAIQAPSAMNLQPWGFVVISGADRLQTYSDRAKAHLLATSNGVSSQARHLLGEDMNIFYGAPVLVVLCATSHDQQAAEDCCLAAQNLMLAAFAAGYGTCPIGFARPWLALEETKLEIGIPKEFVPVFPVIVGFPDEEPPSHGRHPARIVWA